MRSFSVRVAAVAAVAVVAAGCGVAGSGVTAHRSETTTISSESTTTDITLPPTTLLPTTVPPTTTTLAPTTTTVASTTTSGAVPAGWRDLPLDTVPTLAFPPCCASNWSGSPSPVLPDSGEVPDGIFNARRVDWSPGSAQMAIEVRRFEACGVLPAGSCQPSDSYFPDEMGTDGALVRSLTITLDEHVRVVVIGWDSDAVSREASGADLAATFVSLQRSYDDVVAAPFNAGVDPDTIVNGLLAAPAEGFGPPSVDMYGTLIYTSDGAPPLLFQYVIDYTEAGDRVLIDPTSVASLTAIQFDHGAPTLYFYAGYYP